MRNPLHLQELMREHGDFLLWRGLSDLYFVNDPDYLRVILPRGAEQFSKRALDYRVMSQYLGEGLVTSGGELWARQRRLIQPYFAQKNLHRFGEAINTLTASLVDRWSAHLPGTTVRVDREMLGLTLRTAGVTMLGMDISPHVDRLNQILAVINRQPRDLSARLTLVPWLPTPNNRRVRRAKRDLDRIVYGLIAARRTQPAGSGDILHRLIQAHDAGANGSAGGRQTRDEIVTFMFSGHATTGIALTWTLYLLAANPGIQSKIVEKLARRLKGAPAAAEDLPRIPYLQRVVQEALRLYPPVWAITRRAERDHELGDYHLPADAQVGVLIYALHRNSRYWPEPDRFDPDRFHPSRSKDRHFFAYLPFAAGPRTCVGGALAMFQIQLVLAQILQRFEVRPVPGHRVEPIARLTLEPRFGMPLTLTPR